MDKRIRRKKDEQSEVNGRGKWQDKTGLTKKEIGNIVDAMTGIITDTLSRGEKVTLVGFGTFQVMERKAKEGSILRQEKLCGYQLKKSPRLNQGKG